MKKVLSRSLSLACGLILSANAQAQTINTIAPWYREVVADASGNLFLSDGGRIYKRTPSGTATVVAGTGTIGYSGDGGPATAANITNFWGLAVDVAGNIYMGDTGRRIRKINTSGIISTIVGTGVAGYSGDGGPATAAQITWGGNIAADGAGNVYFPDMYRIRKINAAGIITVIAGDGTPGYTGDGGPAIAARISGGGLTIDNAGNIFITDTGRIRKISTSGTIATIAGNGTGTFSGDGGPATAAGFTPHDLAVDGAGNLFIADFGNNRIRKITPSGIISTYAGNGAPSCGGDGGPATAAQIWVPMQVTADGYGNVFAVSGECNGIRKISLSTAGIESHAEGNTLSILPSVNTGAFTIRGTSAGNDEMNLEVTTVTGQKVYSGKVTAKDGTIDQKIVLDNNLPNGMYLMILRSTSGARTEKFIISR